MGKRASKQPLIFRVNWFRKNEQGKFMWPGYGENMRVLKWIVDRVRGRAKAVESPFGLMPRREDLTWEGLEYDAATFYRLMEVDRAAAKAEAEDQGKHFGQFGDRLPAELEKQRQALIQRLSKAPEVWRLEEAA
jgi:phosphoenolpyruvate carboxykinase (GTP)